MVKNKVQKELFEMKSKCQHSQEKEKKMHPDWKRIRKTVFILR